MAGRGRRGGAPAYSIAAPESVLAALASAAKPSLALTAVRAVVDAPESKRQAAAKRLVSAVAASPEGGEGSDVAEVPPPALLSAVFALHLTAGKELQKGTTKCLRLLLGSPRPRAGGVGDAEAAVPLPPLEAGLAHLRPIFASTPAVGALNGLVTALQLGSRWPAAVVAAALPEWLACLVAGCTRGLTAAKARFIDAAVAEYTFAVLRVCVATFQALGREALAQGSCSAAVTALLEVVAGLVCSANVDRDTVVLAATVLGYACRVLVRDPAPCARAALAAWFPASPLLEAPASRELPRIDPSACSNTVTLAFCRSALCTLPLPTLLAPLQGDGPSTPAASSLFFDVLLPPLVAVYSSTKHHETQYLAAQILVSWAQTLARACVAAPTEPTVGPGPSDNLALCVERPDAERSALEAALAMVEDASEKIRQHAKSILASLLQVGEARGKLEHSLGAGTALDVAGTVARRALAKPADSKARSCLLAVAMPSLGVKRLLEACPSLCRDTVATMSLRMVTHKGGLEVYRAFCKELLKAGQDGAAEELWAEHWLPLLVEQLLSPSSDARAALTASWLPATFKQVPGALHLLLSAVARAPSTHHQQAALMTLLCIGRSSGLLTGACIAADLDLESVSSAEGAIRVSLDFVRRCLVHGDEALRQLALEFVCRASKVKEPVTRTESQLVRMVLPKNMNSTSSNFRQHLTSSVKAFVVRFQQSYLAACKRRSRPGPPPEAEEAEEGYIVFSRWLHHLTCASLYPGSSFQRRITALALMVAQLTVVSDLPDSAVWEDIAQPEAGALLASAMDDAHDDVRELACSLLIRHFPPPTVGDEAVLAACNKLLSKALRRLSSPRVRTTASGALYLRVFLEVYAANRCLTYEDGCVASVGDKRGDGMAPTLAFLRRLLSAQLQVARADLLLAARTGPLHGLLLGLRTAIAHFSGRAASADALGLEDLLAQLTETAALALEVMHSSRASDDLPTYADMSESIERHSETGSATDRHLVMALAWLSLKGGAEVYASLVAHHRAALSTDQLLAIGAQFRLILSQSRHRGVIETTAASFTAFVSHAARAGPALAQYFEACCTEEIAAISDRRWSVTRRSAGLPFFILAIVRSFTATVLRTVLTLLLEVAAQTPDSVVEIEDVPQVHALNILRVLFGDAQLSRHVLEFTEEACMLAIASFSSPIWGIRNSSLLLFSALLVRMLGATRGTGLRMTGVASLTPVSFFQRFTALRPFLTKHLGELTARAERCEQGAFPQLHPLLTLLTGLKPGLEDLDADRTSILENLWVLTRCPDFVLRGLAAKAVVSFVPVGAQHALLSSCVAALPASSDPPHRHNEIHGTLLTAQALLEAGAAGSEAQRAALAETLLARSWILSATTNERCGVTRDLWVRVASLIVAAPLLAAPSLPAPSSALGRLIRLEELVPPAADDRVAVAGSTAGFSIGKAFVQHALLPALLATSTADAPPPAASDPVDALAAVLFRCPGDVAEQLLTEILDGTRRHGLTNDGLPAVFEETVLWSTLALHDRAREAAIRLFLHLSLDCPASSQPRPPYVPDTQPEHISRYTVVESCSTAVLGRNQRLRETGFQLLGAALGSPDGWDPAAEDEARRLFCATLAELSAPHCSDQTREAALLGVRAFVAHGQDRGRARDAGPRANPGCFGGDSALGFSIYGALLAALQSEEEELRSLAAKVVGLLSGTPPTMPAQALQDVCALALQVAETADLAQGFAFFTALLRPNAGALAAASRGASAQAVVFDEEAANDYAEPLVASQAALQCLVALASGGDHNPLLTPVNGRRLVEWGRIDEATVGFLVYEAALLGRHCVAALLGGLPNDCCRHPERFAEWYKALLALGAACYILSLHDGERGHAAVVAALPELPALVEAVDAKLTAARGPVLLLRQAVHDVVRASYAGDARSYSELTKQYAAMTAMLGASLVQALDSARLLGWPPDDGWRRDDEDGGDGEAPDGEGLEGEGAPAGGAPDDEGADAGAVVVELAIPPPALGPVDALPVPAAAFPDGCDPMFLL